MMPIFICSFCPPVFRKTFFRPSCISVSITRDLTSNRPSFASNGPPSTREPPVGSERSNGKGTVPMAKHGAACTDASSRGASSWRIPAPDEAPPVPSTAEAATAAAPSAAAVALEASAASVAESGLTGLALIRTLNSRHRRGASCFTTSGLGCAICTEYSPGGSSSSRELRTPRCSPIQSPSGTWRAIRTRSMGKAEPASMKMIDATLSTTGILARTPSAPRKLDRSRTSVGPIDQPRAGNVMPLASAGNFSEHGRPESCSAKSSLSLLKLARPSVTKKGEFAFGLKFNSYVPAGTSATNCPKLSEFATVWPLETRLASMSALERSAGSQTRRITVRSSSFSVVFAKLSLKL
mmetsp:Transcript_50122/g.144397  ORF Transcript_50122/g.144397 Transcript_50122/m.144397 type:complete len:352 (-) Transcript_50122:3157-4212(-)